MGYTFPMPSKPTPPAKVECHVRVPMTAEQLSEFQRLRRLMAAEDIHTAAAVVRKAIQEAADRREPLVKTKSPRTGKRKARK